jgi:hypothetical protein
MSNDLTKAALCAANNADLYEAIFRAHGLAAHRNDVMWWSEETAPPYYSNLTTLDPEAPDLQLAAIERLKAALGHSFSVKDGFCRLALSSLGFRLLFEAAWIWAEPGRFGALSRNRMPSAWRRVSDAASLEAWENAWAGAGSSTDRRVFPPAILRDPQIAVLGRVGAHGFDAGCIANRLPDVIGLSNVFATNEPLPVIYGTAAIAAAAFAPDLPLVGYEGGEALGAAVAAGLEPVGPLRVWLSD